jgi:hypothetical protein
MEASMSKLRSRPNAIVYRATVEGVSSVDVTIEAIPASDGEEPIVRGQIDGQLLVNVPGAANAEDVGETLRAFGALVGLRGAVRITIEPDQEGSVPEESVPEGSERT